MKKFLPLLLAAINLISPLKAADQSVQSTINRMANELTATYRSKSPNAKRARLAILDLQASEDLNKQRIGPALTDMITNEFVNKSDFTVLERELFGKIMEEHQLLANFGDISNAIKVGKVLGAEVVLLGSVTQFKGDLRINLRLVNTETTEILSTTAGVIAFSEFSQQNPELMAYVPVTQKIGLFAEFDYRFPGTDNTPLSTSRTEFGPTSIAETLDLNKNQLMYAGFGVRYYPVSRFYFEGAYLINQKSEVGTSTLVQSSTFTGTRTYTKASESSGRIIRVAVGTSKNINRQFSVEFRGGLEINEVVFSSLFAAGNPEVKRTLPFLGVGLNFSPQRRLSISLSALSELGSLSVKEITSGSSVIDLSPIHLTPRLTFYF